MHAEGTQPTLESVLTEEVLCTECLLSCLGAERLALTARVMDALQNTTREKLDLTGRLEQLELQREAAAHDANGVDRVDESFDVSPEQISCGCPDHDLVAEPTERSSGLRHRAESPVRAFVTAFGTRVLTGFRWLGGSVLRSRERSERHSETHSGTEIDTADPKKR